MSDLYKTIESPAEAVFTEKRSKFLAFAYPIETVDDINEPLKELSRRFYDARHICWAYMLGTDRTVFRANDNGEPSGTAGKPILGQINSYGLTNIFIAVVRYFGGIKLGTSGLIAAYKQAAHDVIEAASVVERHEMGRLEFTYPYEVMNNVMKVCRRDGVNIISTSFDNSCRVILEVELDQMDICRNTLDNIDGLTFVE